MKTKKGQQAFFQIIYAWQESVEFQIVFYLKTVQSWIQINKIINSQKIVNTDYSRCFPSHGLWYPTQISYQKICRLVAVLHITIQFLKYYWELDEEVNQQLNFLCMSVL